jgi:hypothetical protein
MKNPCRFVAAVATLCLIAGAANAQPTLVGKAPARKGGDAGGNTLNVLYCDTYVNGLYGLVSQNFPDYPSVSSCTYDDFTVPDGETWCKEGMGVEGFYNYISNGDTTGCVREYCFKVVGNLGGCAPDCGNNVCFFCGPPGIGIETPNVFGQSGGRFDYCPGGVVANLGPGTYWASGYVTMPFATPTFCGQWYFVTSAQPHRRGCNAYLDNPGGGFGIPPCVNWTFLGQDGDMTFCIYGTLCDDVCPCEVTDGNTDTGNGNPPADTVSIDGSTGDACGALAVAAGSATTLAIASAPTVGKGHWGLWINDGVTLDCCPLTLCGGKGTFALGTAVACLQVNNTCVPGSVPCPVTFPTGRTSKSLGAGKAATLCLNKKPGFAKSPTTFSQVFPSGLYTVQGLVQDLNSINSPAKNIGISNGIRVTAL